MRRQVKQRMDTWVLVGRLIAALALVGLCRALAQAPHEVGLKPRLFESGRVGLQFATFQTKLGPKLNGIVNYDFGDRSRR